MMSAGQAPHQPVLYQESLDALQPRDDGLYVDGTLGAGGHAAGILVASAPSGRLLGLDVDPQALAIAGERLAGFGERATLVRASYSQIAQQLAAIGWDAVDGILLDLGASSMQFDTAERGFAFSQDGPLDMRMDPDLQRSAADLVNELPEKDLADLIYEYGEEARARTIARRIVQERPIHGTAELAGVVARALRARRGGIHPATRTFQALRIAVNDELDNLQAVLPQAMEALKAGGRLVVIAFHSLEDRLVKQYFRQESRDCICPPEQLVCTCEHQASINEVTRKPIRPSSAEEEQNPRARSARLRVAEKLSSTER